LATVLVALSFETSCKHIYQTARQQTPTLSITRTSHLINIIQAHSSTV